MYHKLNGSRQDSGVYSRAFATPTGESLSRVLELDTQRSLPETAWEDVDAKSVLGQN